MSKAKKKATPAKTALVQLQEAFDEVAEADRAIADAVRALRDQSVTNERMSDLQDALTQAENLPDITELAAEAILASETCEDQIEGAVRSLLGE